MGFEGGHAKNMASKGGQPKKIWCLKGGGVINKECLKVYPMCPIDEIR